MQDSQCEPMRSERQHEQTPRAKISSPGPPPTQVKHTYEMGKSDLHRNSIMLTTLALAPNRRSARRFSAEGSQR